GEIYLYSIEYQYIYSSKIPCIMSKVKTKKVNDQKNLQPTLFDLCDFGKKKVEVQFTTEQISTDGGLLFLKEVDRQIGLIGSIVSCFEDNRHQSYVKHDTKSLVKQRVMQI